MSKISATIVADSINSQGDRLTSLLITFPRILLSEINTHRMLSKNTSSSRAIPFNKMIEAVMENPFIPIAWQKNHSGMQGTEYFTNPLDIQYLIDTHLQGRDAAVQSARLKSTKGLTKQLCNRDLEPYMWTTMLITGSKEGWDNFFNLRCSSYIIQGSEGVESIPYKSKKEIFDFIHDVEHPIWSYTDLDWLKINKGQAEIHMMALAECIYDAVNESTPKLLEMNQWHIPFIDKINYVPKNIINGVDFLTQAEINISVALAARTSYTVVGEEKTIDYKAMINLHDRLLTQDPPHSSPFEHTCIAVTQEEYDTSLKGQEKGWFRNYKGFKSYRQIIEESK